MKRYCGLLGLLLLALSGAAFAQTPESEDAARLKRETCEEDWELIRFQIDHPDRAFSVAQGKDVQNPAGTSRRRLKERMDAYIERCSQPDNPHLGLARSLLEQLEDYVQIPDLHHLDYFTLRTKTEYFTFRVLYGGVSAGAELGFATLRWQHLIVEPLRFGFFFGKWLDWRDIRHLWAGGAVGVQGGVGPDKRDELRLLGGLSFGLMGTFEPISNSSRCYGPFVSLDAMWVRHLAQHFSSQFGLKLMLPTWYRGEKYPPGLLAFFWGFSI